MSAVGSGVGKEGGGVGMLELVGRWVVGWWRLWGWVGLVVGGVEEGCCRRAARCGARRSSLVILYRFVASRMVCFDSWGEKKWMVYIHCGFPYPVRSSSWKRMSRLA